MRINCSYVLSIFSKNSLISNENNKIRFCSQVNFSGTRLKLFLILEKSEAHVLKKVRLKKKRVMSFSTSSSSMGIKTATSCCIWCLYRAYTWHCIIVLTYMNLNIYKLILIFFVVVAIQLYSFFQNCFFYKNMSIASFQFQEQLEPRFSKNKNKNNQTKQLFVWRRALDFP